jgi:hypothetical protein
MTEKGWRKLIFSASAALWLAVCAAGFWVLIRYQTTPGKAGSLPAAWPAASVIRPSPGLHTLVLFAHPQCPCTRATIDGLAWTMARSRGKIAAYALFTKPSAFPDGWEKSDLWQKASAIPGVKALSDADGAEARLFGAETSGQVALYDPKGRLAFRGGLTGARGHFGDNPGRDAVLSLIQLERTGKAESLVFGCSLLRNDPDRDNGDRSWPIPRLMKIFAR